MSERRRGGTVTFVFTDIEGSTRLVQEFKDRWPGVRSAHRRIVRAAFEAHGGDEVDTQGDSFFYVFGLARDAALAAAQAQRELAAHDWPEGGEVRIRIGMHTGEPVVSDEGYHGIGVHRAARIMAAGHGGQVLLSEATAAVLRDEEVAGVAVRDLGVHMLKDLDRPEHVFQLVAEDLEPEFPRIRTAAAPRAFYRRPLVIGAVAGVLAAAVAIPVFALAGGSGDSSTLDRAEENGVAVVDGRSRGLVAATGDLEAPQAIAAGHGSLWVTTAKDGGSLARLDPRTHDVVQTIKVGSGPRGVAVTDSAVWVANSLDRTVSRISPESNTEVEQYAVGNAPTAIAAGHGAVWVTNANDGTVSKLDPGSGDVLDTIRVGAPVRGVAVGAGAVWLTDPVGNALVRLDGRSTSRVNVGSGPTAVAVRGGDVWVANNLDGTVSRVDAARGAVTGTFPVGAAPNGIAVTEDAVWVSDEVTGQVARVDPASGSTQTTHLSGRPEGLAAHGGAVWVAVQAAGNAHRGGTLRLRTFAPDFIDPARSYLPASWQLLAVTNDGLVGFKRVGGADGNTLVPDLATGLPQPSDHGRTYVFRLRKGIRFSSGHELRAADVRWTFERLFRSHTPRVDFWSGIVGAKGCAARPQTCTLSRGIEVDDASGTVTFHLTGRDSEFLYKLAMPFGAIVPKGTPPGGDRPVPATGPYLVKKYTPEKYVRLERNPAFRVWSRSAQPEGIPDVIEATATADTKVAFEAVERGRADLAVDVPPAELERARTQYPAQLRITPIPQVKFVVFNTSRPPFSSKLARQAVALAFDRQATVDGAGGSDFAAPTCQVLPPNFPGYAPYCPSTAGAATAEGVWKAPDLARARRLVASSGTRGAHVDLLGATNPFFGPGTAELVRTLRRLGYRVSVTTFDEPGAFFAEWFKGADRYEATLNAWSQDYPAASNFVVGLLGCVNSPYVCDPKLEASFAAAQAVQSRDPERGDEEWARIEHRAVDDALVAPFSYSKGIEFVSKRLGNYQRHPIFVMLVGQVWVQ